MVKKNIGFCEIRREELWRVELIKVITNVILSLSEKNGLKLAEPCVKKSILGQSQLLCPYMTPLNLTSM